MIKTDVIRIGNNGEGFKQAEETARKAAAEGSLNRADSLRLVVMTEEMLSMARTPDENLSADFWIEREGQTFSLHLSAEMALDKQQRDRLIRASTAQQNEAARSFLGRIRDAFEQARAAKPEAAEPSREVRTQTIFRDIVDPEWGEFECSILRRLANEIRISIRGKTVDMTVSRTFRN